MTTAPTPLLPRWPTPPDGRAPADRLEHLRQYCWGQCCPYSLSHSSRSLSFVDIVDCFRDSSRYIVSTTGKYATAKCLTLKRPWRRTIHSFMLQKLANTFRNKNNNDEDSYNVYGNVIHHGTSTCAVSPLVGCYRRHPPSLHTTRPIHVYCSNLYRDM